MNGTSGCKGDGNLEKACSLTAANFSKDNCAGQRSLDEVSCVIDKICCPFLKIRGTCICPFSEQVLPKQLTKPDETNLTLFPVQAVTMHGLQ